MIRGEYSVILLFSTSHAIRAEKILQKEEIGCKMIPVPRQLSSNCGVCIRIDRHDREAAGQALEAIGIETDGIHDI